MFTSSIILAAIFVSAISGMYIPVEKAEKRSIWLNAPCQTNSDCHQSSMGLMFGSECKISPFTNQGVCTDSLGKRSMWPSVCRTDRQCDNMGFGSKCVVSSSSKTGLGFCQYNLAGSPFDDKQDDWLKFQTRIRSQVYWKPCFTFNIIGNSLSWNIMK